MGRDGLFIGEVAVRSGATRKALRLYEDAGILPTARRTAAGYRVYGHDTLALLEFIAQARRLGFSLDEIKEIVGIRRSGRLPCPHVRDLVHRKLTDLDRTLADLTELRDALRRLLRSRSGARQKEAAVCPHIEGSNGPKKGGSKRWPGGKAKSPGVSTQTEGARSL